MLKNHNLYSDQVTTKTKKNIQWLFVCVFVTSLVITTWPNFHPCLAFSSSILGERPVFFLPRNVQIWWSLCWENQNKTFIIWKFPLKNAQGVGVLKSPKTHDRHATVGFSLSLRTFKAVTYLCVPCTEQETSAQTHWQVAPGFVLHHNPEGLASTQSAYRWDGPEPLPGYFFQL